MGNGAFIAIFTSFMSAIITIAIKKRKDKPQSMNIIGNKQASVVKNY